MKTYELYSRVTDHETIFKIWGSSTKHPDSIFYFSDYKPCDWFKSEIQIIPWLFECASKMNKHAYCITKWAHDTLDKEQTKAIL